MARPKTDHGFTRLANEYLDQLIGVGLTGREFKIILAIIRKTWGWRQKQTVITLSEFEKMTGIKPNHCTEILKLLTRKNMIVRKKVGNLVSYGPQKDYTLWKLDISQVRVVPKQDYSQNGTTPVEGNLTTPVEGNLLLPYKGTPTIKERIKERRKERREEGAGFKDFVQLFNSNCPSLPKVLDITTKRKKKIGSRLSTDPDMQFWEDIFKRVEASEWCSGRAGDWRASFDWIMEPSNLQKIKEGTYDNKKGSQADILEKIREVKARYS